MIFNHPTIVVPVNIVAFTGIAPAKLTTSGVASILAIIADKR